MPMKILDRKLKKKRTLVFVGLEGTGFSHEMIEIGAYLATINEDGTIKKVGAPFKRYVLAHHPIGHFVENMTGITPQLLKKEGKPFAEVLREFRKYVGKHWEDSLFVTFGNHDMVIFHKSLEENEDASEIIVKHINRNNFDFSAFLAPYVQDLNGNPLSLANYLKVFQVPFEGRAHDALADAYNLMDLYKAVLARNDILVEEYGKTLTHYHHAPYPVTKIIKKLTEGESVSPEDWGDAVAETFK